MTHALSFPSGTVRILYSPRAAYQAAARHGLVSPPPALTREAPRRTVCINRIGRRTPMAIALSHGGPTIYRSATPSRQVLVGTIEGVVCIERDPSGHGWHVADRSLTDKHVHALLIEPESGTIFAG